jgi:signal transduction histidine kinase
MTPRIARVVAWSAVAVGWALVVGAALLSWWAGDPAPSAPEFKGLIMGPIETLVLGLLLVGLFGGTGALIVSRFPTNLLGWTFTFSALIVSTTLVGSSYAYAGLVVRPGDLPGARVATVLLGDALWLPFVSIQIVGLLVLFPDGRLASSGRRWIFLLGLAGAVIGSLGFAISPEVYAIKLPNPLAFGPKVVSDTLAGIGFLMVLGAGIAAVASLIGRFRRSRGDERQQMKWFVYAAALMLVTLIPVTVLEDTPAWMQLLSGITTALLPVAVGVAILKYRLYDIDLVINKTLVYAILAGFITAVFLTLVVGVGTIAGGGNTFLAAVAAALVAVVFQPVRRWAQHLANRLVYGDRATPYEVLSRFSERLAETYSIEDVLPRTARVLTEGLGADGVAIVLRENDRRETAARWPADAGDRGQDTRSFEVRHQGALLGEIEVAMSPGEPLDPGREKLVRDVAAQAGLVLRNARLIADLRSSRQRLVAAQDEERRRLERNIHDGAQQQLVALAVKLRLADSLVGRDEARMHELLAELQSETNDALEDLRDLARGIYPPLLADQGLGAALASQSRKASVPVTLDTEGIGRYPRETEVAVYFSCLEALQNVAKYANATSATVRLTQANGGLTFEVTDDGVGFDPAAAERGTGLQGIADRLAALGGDLEITSAPGSGTTIAGRLPATLVEASL